MTPAKSLTTGLLVAGVLVGIYAALGTQSPAEAGSPKPAAAESLPVGHPAPTSQADGSPTQISGKVTEVIQVAAYTYLRLERGEQEELWVAVPKSDVPRGKTVRVARAERMENFTSKQLERTFPVIYFGTLEIGLPDTTSDNPHAAAPGERSGRAAAADLVTVVPAERAEGDSGHTIREIHEQAAKLAGATVRVRGTVVQITMNVMGTNFVHVRDGSGDASQRTHDLVLKIAEDPPDVGKQALFEGKVESNVDLGAGYTYSVLVSDATVVNDE